MNAPTSKPRLRSLLKLTRFPLVFTAVADSAAGYFLMRGGRTVDWLAFGLITAASACLYACGMVFNDALDHNLDRLRHKERPIPSGEVTAEQARRFGMVLFIVADTLACAVQFTAGIAAFVAFLLIMIYNGYAKERGLLGALVMGSIRFANFGLGIFAAGLTRRQFIAFPTGNAWAAAGILGGYVVLLTLLSQLEEKPSRPRLLICSTLMLLAPVGAWAMGPTTMAAITAGALVLLVGGVAAAGAVVPSKESTMRAVLWSIVGIILLDATFVFARGSEMEPRGAAIAALILPVLATRPLFKNL